MNLMNAFKKKDENDVPDVSSMINSGMSQQDIIDSLRQQGYDISIIGVALTIITAISPFSYANTPLGKGLMAASTTIGMLFGALSIGYITDVKGRKFMYLWDMVIFIVFTAAITLSFNFWSLFIFRLIGLLLTIFLAPETKDKSLEELTEQ